MTRISCPVRKVFDKMRKGLGKCRLRDFLVIAFFILPNEERSRNAFDKLVSMINDVILFL